MCKFFPAKVNISDLDKYLIGNFAGLHEDRFQDQVIVIEIGLCSSSTKYHHLHQIFHFGSRMHL